MPPGYWISRRREGCTSKDCRSCISQKRESRIFIILGVRRNCVRPALKLRLSVSGKNLAYPMLELRCVPGRSCSIALSTVVIASAHGEPKKDTRKSRHQPTGFGTWITWSIAVSTAGVGKNDDFLVTESGSQGCQLPLHMRRVLRHGNHCRVHHGSEDLDHFAPTVGVYRAVQHRAA